MIRETGGESFQGFQVPAGRGDQGAGLGELIDGGGLANRQVGDLMPGSIIQRLQALHGPGAVRLPIS